MRGTNEGWLLGRSLVAMMATSALPALAQQAVGQEQTSRAVGDSPMLDEIVVTAQKRGENLQKVPLSVSSFNAATLASSGVNAVIEIGQIDASTNFSSNTGTVIPYIRGIGNSAANIIGNEASVPVYIDDVYYTRLSSAYLELPNVERVEVLKGPQGTLFGRNSSGGAIQIFTRDPGEEFKASGKIGYARFDTVYGDVYLGGALSDRIRADISVSGLDQQDGWGRNVTSGEDVGKARFINVRGKLIFDLGDTTKIRLIGYYSRMRTSQGLNNDIYRGTISGTPPLPSYGPSQPLIALPGFYDTRNTATNSLNNESAGGSIKLDQELAFANLTSITAYRKQTEAYDPVDGDGTAFKFLQYRLHSTDTQFSQELQFKSPVGSPVKWILGAYYLDSRQGYDPTTVTGDALTSLDLSEQRIFGRQKIKSVSGYGQATFPVVDSETNITLGLRYTSDRVHGEGRQEVVIPGLGIVPGQVPYDKAFTFNKLTYRVALDHQFTNDVLGYVSFSRGYKSGTFNTLPLTADPTRPETVDAYEAGLKTELLGRRLRLNSAVFQNDVQNPQVSTVITTGTVSTIGLTNAQKSRIRGAEFNLEALLDEGLRLTAGATYLDARYLGFLNAPFYATNPGAPYGLLNPVAGNAAGNRLAQVPEWRFDLGLNYELKTSAGLFSASANWAHTGNYFWDPDNANGQDGVDLVNASLAFRPAGFDQLSVRIWGKNLAGEKYYIQQQELAGSAGHLGGAAPPRTYGAELAFAF